MRHFTFKREAKWLMWLTLTLPVIGIFLVVILPGVLRWLGVR
jgi:hypothetical protein